MLKEYSNEVLAVIFCMVTLIIVAVNTSLVLNQGHRISHLETRLITLDSNEDSPRVIYDRTTGRMKRVTSDN